MAGHIFPVLPTKHLVNQDGELTVPHNLTTGTKLSVSNVRVLFFQCVVQKGTSHVHTKAFKMRHQSQKGFRGINDGIIHDEKSTQSTYLVH